MQENILENDIKKEKIITKCHLITFIICAVSAAVLIFSRNNEIFANFISNTLSYYIRWILSRITYFLPFSLAEFLLYLSVPLVILFLVNFNIRLFRKKELKRKAIYAARNLLNVISAGAIIFILFVWTLGTLYYKTPVEKSVGLNREKLSVNELYNAFAILASELGKIDLSPYVTEGELSTSMPHNYAEMSRRINESYDKLSDRYLYYDNVGVRVKPVIMSEIMSRMHITGVYSFFTGESNINVQFPDYSLPFTAAHEIAHIRGVAREDEANFTAFLICYNSDDPYIRYSGIVNMIEYLSSPLYGADKDLYIDAYSRLGQIVTDEFRGFNEFFSKYKDTEISKVADKVNDSYLKSQGQEEGTKSYGMVVDLAVAYLLQK